MKLKFLFFIIIPINIYAQDNTALLQTYFSEVQAGSYAPVPQSILNEEAQANELLTALVTYQNDSNEVIRTRAYNISKRIGQNHLEIAIRQQAINQQIKALDGKDAGIMVKAINALAGFQNTDFNFNQQLKIINRLKADMPHLAQYVRLVGYMPNEAAVEALQQVQLQVTDGWESFNLNLALARRGDEQATTTVLNKIQNAQINDAFVYDIVPVLVYTRSIEIFDFLEELIFSDEADCSSANPDSNANILCGYRIMEYVAPAIENFPLPTDEYGELEVDDYETALVTLREWLIQNPDYQLVKDTY
ncbi:hypothetical protein ABWH96_19050 [Marivirga tractuosa]|uniref:hypothetical protein n=1 Tax=Marivirga tractuosa TaxID=1006 RepID=UPI0035CF9D0A